MSGYWAVGVQVQSCRRMPAGWSVEWNIKADVSVNGFFLFHSRMPIVCWGDLICSDFLGKRSRSRYTRLRTSFSLQEGRMRALWRSRGAGMSSSSRFGAPNTCTRFACSTPRRLISWSSLFLQVICLIFFLLFFIGQVDFIVTFSMLFLMLIECSWSMANGTLVVSLLWMNWTIVGSVLLGIRVAYFWSDLKIWLTLDM